MSLTIGRVVLNDPDRWDDSYSRGRYRERIRGVHQASSLAQSKADRQNLKNQVGELVRVVFSEDSSRNGFYRLESPSVDAEDYELNDTGQWDYSITLDRIGTFSSTEFQSLISNQLKANDHGIIRTGVNFWQAPPIGALGRTVGDTSGSTGEITRTGSEGDLNVAIGIPDTSAKWTIDPASYYAGGCYVMVDGIVRTGIDVPLDADDWEIGNSLVKVTPGLTSSVSDGTIEVAHYDDGLGAFATAKDYEILYATTTRVSEWPKMKILKNTPEVVGIELMEDANEAGGNKYTRHSLRLWIRRGGLMVFGYYHYDGAASTWTVQRATAEAATAVQPTGSTPSDMAVRASSNDADGNRYIIGSAVTDTIESTQGGLDFASRQGFDFFVSSEINGSSAQTQDLADGQCLQYLAISNEQVRPVPR